MATAHINTKGKQLKFKIITILLPFLLLFIIELLLRIFHFGYNTSVILEDKNLPGFCYLNPEVSKKYFTSEQLATFGNKDYFRKKKDSNTFRIFVLGESTALGFPYNHNGSFPRMLKYRLERSYNHTNFEIINCAIVGVNSYTVLDISREVVNYQPDAVILYVGHNEYYGALGVGSTNKVGSKRFIVKTIVYLKNYRIFQALLRFKEFIFKMFHPDSGKYKNRMERMADKNVLFNSKLYHAGIKQFEDNLKEILKIYNNKRIPVFIGNLISNEKDQMPFESQTIIPHQNDEWYKLYTTALGFLKEKDKDNAIKCFDKLNAIDSTYATAQFFKGQLAYERGNYTEAKCCFVNAKELDIIRFRAPEKLNDIIQSNAKKFKSYFVDVKKAFEEKSPHGIIGKELVLEHVHPNLEGYHIIADEFFNAINQSGLIKSDYKEQDAYKIKAQYPVTPVDSIRGAYEIYMLRESWPFNEKIPDSVSSKGSYFEQLAGGLAVKQLQWNQTMSMLENYYIKNQDKFGQLRVNEALALEYPFEIRFLEKAAYLSTELNDFDRASFYYEKAFQLQPDFQTAQKAMLAFLKLDDPLNSMIYIDYCIANNTSGYDMLAFKKLVLQVVDLQKQFLNNPENKVVISEIIAVYRTLGNETGVRKYQLLLNKK